MAEQLAQDRQIDEFLI
ncbi:MAG: hypothetical protein ACRC7D_00270 [Aeromonas popoffii]